ncbi:MAG: VOC family protein [Pseudomonadota bacterium]
MIDHISIGVAEFARSTAFYDAALAPLGVTRMVDVPLEHSGGVLVCGYGDSPDRAWFWLAEERATSGLLHIAFEAATRAQVDAFHAAALKAGGTDNGAPGLRPQYSADYYGAFVHDPDGHNVEAVCRVGGHKERTV